MPLFDGERGKREEKTHNKLRHWLGSNCGGCNTRSEQGYVLAVGYVTVRLRIQHFNTFQWDMHTNIKILSQTCFFHIVSLSESEKNDFSGSTLM